MRDRRFSLALLVGALLVLSVAPGVALAEPDQEVRVGLTEWSITPNPISVRAGEKVTFIGSNRGTLNHDLRIEGQGVAMDVVPGDSMHIPPGQTATFEFTFARPGTYQMWCPVGAGSHRQQGMDGAFVVTAAATSAAAPPAQVPRALPRTGESSALSLGLLALASAGLVTAGTVLRRRN